MGADDKLVVIDPKTSGINQKLVEALSGAPEDVFKKIQALFSVRVGGRNMERVRRSLLDDPTGVDETVDGI